MLQTTIVAGAHFAAHVDAPDGYALVGCDVAPGFEFAEFQLTTRSMLTARVPAPRPADRALHPLKGRPRDLEESTVQHAGAAIEPTDEDAYRAILETTSAEDRYCRFFHLVDHFDPEEVHRFVETRPDMIGVIAHDGDVPLGAAHAALLDDESAELAIVVSRDRAAARRRRGRCWTR